MSNDLAKSEFWDMWNNSKDFRNNGRALVICIFFLSLCVMALTAIAFGCLFNAFSFSFIVGGYVGLIVSVILGVFLIITKDK